MSTYALSVASDHRITPGFVFQTALVLTYLLVMVTVAVSILGNKGITYLADTEAGQFDKFYLSLYIVLALFVSVAVCLPIDRLVALFTTLPAKTIIIGLVAFSAASIVGIIVYLMKARLTPKQVAQMCNLDLNTVWPSGRCTTPRMANCAAFSALAGPHYFARPEARRQHPGDIRQVVGRSGVRLAPDRGRERFAHPHPRRLWLVRVLREHQRDGGPLRVSSQSRGGQPEPSVRDGVRQRERRL
jgi:hypothetical protein